MTKKKKIIISSVCLYFVFLAYLFFWPTSLEPIGWTPPENAGFVADFSKNSKLDNLEFISSPNMSGPEDLVFDEKGRLYTGYDNGQIVRFTNLEGVWVETPIINTGGRPLGMKFGQDGNLYVADAERGLLLITPKGKLEVLVGQFNGQPMKLVDHLDISSKGIIYFSDASDKYAIEQATADILEHAGRGRIFQYNIHNKETQLLLEGVNFANGIALSKDESFIIICETGSYQLRKFYLEGENKGQSEVLIDNLPGFPDNISRDSQGNFWVAFASNRNDMLDMFSPYAFLKKAIYRIPEAFHLKPESVTHVMKIDGNGQVLASLQSRNSPFEMVTSAVVNDGVLYIGSLHGKKIGYKALIFLSRS